MAWVITIGIFGTLLVLLWLTRSGRRELPRTAAQREADIHSAASQIRNDPSLGGGF